MVIPCLIFMINCKTCGMEAPFSVFFVPANGKEDENWNPGACNSLLRSLTTGGLGGKNK